MGVGLESLKTQKPKPKTHNPYIKKDGVNEQKSYITR
jgi:hypothetical protein